MRVCENIMGFIEILISLFYVNVTNVPMEVRGGEERVGGRERRWLEADVFCHYQNM